MPRDSDDRDRERRRRHRRRDEGYRRGHRQVDSGSSLLPRDNRNSRNNDTSYDTTGDTISASPSPRKHRRDGSADEQQQRKASVGLSLDALAQLDRMNEHRGWSGAAFNQDYLEETRAKEVRLEKERRRDDRKARRADKERRRADAERREAEDAAAVAEADKRSYIEQREKWRRRHEERPAASEEYDEREYVSAAEERVRVYREDRHKRRYTESEKEDRRRRRREGTDTDSRNKKKKARIVSGPVLELGEKSVHEYKVKQRGGKGSSRSSSSRREPWWKRRWKWLAAAAVILVILIIAIAVGVVVSKNKGSNNGGGGGGGDTSARSSQPSNSNLDGHNQDEYPQGTYFDPFTWYDTDDFNLTYTGELVGGLPIMGLNSSWNDDVQCNPNVPPLKDSWDYGTMPIRGINVGGWLCLEPFITPSFFEKYSTRDNVVDEWTLTSALGSSRAAQTLEEHYSSFIDRQTFVDIRNAGFDHVRIPFSYWAVTTYSGDPYVKQISWRYLLRGIEWARQQGLRVNLDMHGLPGSQNGWNHSGRLGAIGWLNGTNGALNAQRSLEIHDQLSTFFAQPRYQNLVTMYGLVNEPRMTELDTNSVLNWTTSAIDLVRGNGIKGVIVFGDGFRGLDKWQGELSGQQNLLLDVHQYVIFNVDQLKLNHQDKLNFACKGWTAQMARSQNTATGFGPTMCGEWSQADTDCAEYLNNVGIGSRWEGTLNTGNATSSVLSPTCPTNNSPGCECNDANADPSAYSDAYKQWLQDFAEAQMDSFEVGWGWFYWTWDTEKSVQWSYKKGMAAGILPQKTYERKFSCNQTIPDFASMGLPEQY